jgi:archaellum component FlaC
MKYSNAEVQEMKEKVRNLKALLAEEKNAQRRTEIQNQINGLEANISGAHN